MTSQISYSLLTCAVVVGLLAASPCPANAQDATSPLMLAAAKVSIAGTSNIHEYTAATGDVRVTRIALANGVSGVPARGRAQSRCRRGV